MEDLDQLGNKRLNNLFPINYFHREKIISVDPLKFEHIYYNKGDVFQVLETGDTFVILTKPDYTNGTYAKIKHLNGSNNLKSGYSTAFVKNDISEKLYRFKPDPFFQLARLLGSKDYYHVADIIYDLSNKIDEIPDKLINFIFETCDETNIGK